MFLSRNLMALKLFIDSQSHNKPNHMILLSNFNMGRESPSSSSYDEVFMQHSLHFSDSLKELRSLRKQLYSAAEYFELSYGEDEHKHLVVDGLKDYLSKAVVSTVDHLGSVASKLDTFLDEKVDEFSSTKLRFSCIEQKSRSYQEFIDRSGLMQQSLVIIAPKHQKHYMNPDEKFAPQNYFEGDMHPIEKSLNPQAFSFTAVASNIPGKQRSRSPLRFMLKRSGSSYAKSGSVLESKKTKHMFKALLSIHRPPKGVE